MKKHVLATGATLLIAATASAIVFTTDTTISPLNTNYDGTDIVISNCVVTIDGPHNFASLRVAGTGVLTHTYDPSGSISIFVSVTNEPAALSGTNATSLANSNVNPASIVVNDLSGSVTFSNEVDYLVGVAVDGKATVQRTDSSSIPDGETVFVSYNYLAQSVGAGLNLAITGDATVAPSAAIDVSARGYAAGLGAGGSAGSAPTGSGGGHGGYGGVGATNGSPGQAYGSTMLPNELGSGGGGGLGGAGGIGGGLVRISVAGSFLINGTILANGANATDSRSGGGSGGSIWVTAQTFAGFGAIHADGGAGEPILGGGGGGGRIAIDFATNNFSGVISAFGGAGWQRGGAGTILVRPSGAAGSVTFDNGGLIGATTLLGVTNAPDLTIKGSAIALLKDIETVGNLLVRSNSSIQLGANGLGALTLTVLSNATIDAGASVTMDGRGYAQNTGPGAGSLNRWATAGGGGGHGGFGGSGTVLTGTPPYLDGAAGGLAYDSISIPSSAGSGGRGVSAFSGGSGGGVIRLIVSGSLQLNGRISAEATAGVGNATGGGAGGSIFLTLGGFSGAGTISANGGSGGLPNGGGGAGGRIAITWASNSFTGSMLARGGQGAVAGGAGTIYTSSPGHLLPRLVADNGGVVGTNTDFNLSNISSALLTGAASATSTVATVTVSNLVIGSGSVFQVGQTFTLNTTSLAVNPGGAISADGASTSTLGGGSVGGSPGSGSGGAGHGGYGGRGASGVGGTSGYDSVSEPSAPGGRGGFLGNGPAPNGGGYMRIMASSLQIEGRVSVNGISASTNNNGGGSGGSIWITTTTMSGGGGLFAEGGAGNLPFGGGGAGGRIAIYYTTNSFTGILSAKGGAGYAAGGAGTVYLKPAGNAVARLILDNGGLVGTNTVIDSQFFGDLRILGGSMATSAVTRINLTGLMIGTNSAFLLGGPNSVNLTISSNADVSGSISLDGAESQISYGTGSGSGGAGHGGFGGSGKEINSRGGNAFDLTTSPTLPGSHSGGSSGGGALRMTLNGSLNLNGRISANGTAGIVTNSMAMGGGAGGSIYLTLGGLSGSGSLSADGAAGAITGGTLAGGGGGGGRMAVYYTSNTFTGTFSARGGAGYVAGGAGTIYLSRRDRPADLIVDNGGNRGTNSLIDSSIQNLGNLTIIGGGSVTSAAPTLTVSNLLVGASSALQFGQSGTLNVFGNATVGSLGLISSDGTGNGPGAGGGLPTTFSSGGGHGGYGGLGIGLTSGGVSTDSPSSPTQAGGRGGGNGGLGGGALRLNITKLLQLDGVLSANGASATTNTSGGGGAGGSVWVSAASLAGTGAIAANGGAGRLPGDGGGGGGRIAVTWMSNSFTGQYIARGGAGYVYGGAGSVYLKGGSGQFGQIPQVIVDNGGIRGTNTGLIGIDLYDLTVQGGAVAFASGGPAAPRLHSLLVRSNGWVNAGGPLGIAANATIEAGGGIFIDGTGNDPSGAGLNSTTQAGGGGHGGYGGLRQIGKGGVYDSILSPVRTGSAGGSALSGSSSGALGGGNLNLSVAGILQLDGLISANGLNGDNNGGGGSGGSLWLTIGSLSGSGIIAARGGNGNNLGGGGGGGRIAIYAGTNFFTGSVSAAGGSGYQVGGAGSVYVKTNNQPADLLTLDNSGATGEATPVSPTFGSARNLVVANGAIGQLQSVLPVFSNVTVNAGGQLTGSSIIDTNLNLVISGNLLVATGAVFKVDALGFAQAQGPGAGNSSSNKGSGGGYGGYGGNSGSDAAGGAPYGSGTLPVERGSGGGLGGGPSAGGSEGGGALRVLVGGRATIDGLLSAYGGNGIQDDSGGGSGGSILFLANKLSGNGFIVANGGDGELYGGGGGAGGRVALYSPANSFRGNVSMTGGMGAFNGNSGSLYESSVFPTFQVISQNPSGIVSNLLAQITLEFDSALDPASVNSNDIILRSPSGIVPGTAMAFSFPAPSTLQIDLPVQNTPGHYQLEAGPNISNVLGQPMSQVYTGAFTLNIPAILGRITGTNGNPISGVVLYQSNGPLTATTDATGAYAFGVLAGWTGNLMPSLGSFVFAPATRSYTNVTGLIASQDYVAVNSLAATLASQVRGTNFAISWFGIGGATYQPQYSTNLVDWLPYDGTIIGTNGPAELLIHMDADPQKFFRISTSN